VHAKVNHERQDLPARSVHGSLLSRRAFETH
jgi:hypothetical protein